MLAIILPVSITAQFPATGLGRENVIPLGHRFAQPAELGWFLTGGKGKKMGAKRWGIEFFLPSPGEV